MFSGLIKSKARLDNVKKINEGMEIAVHMLASLAPYSKGESIAINGICLTLVKSKGNRLTFFCQRETLKKTTIRFWHTHEILNIEKSLKLGDALGGHFVLGHVDAIGEIIQLKTLGKGWQCHIQTHDDLQKYAVLKGSIAVDGISLTLNKIKKNIFQVDLIPETIKHTNVENWKKGAFVNVEFDYFGKYVYNIMHQHSMLKHKKNDSR